LAVWTYHRHQRQADISLHCGETAGHVAVLIELAHCRALEPIMLDDHQVEIISTATPSTCRSSASSHGLLKAARLGLHVRRALADIGLGGLLLADLGGTADD
jgi:hypothetical protein